MNDITKVEGAVQIDTAKIAVFQELQTKGASIQQTLQAAIAAAMTHASDLTHKLQKESEEVWDKLLSELGLDKSTGYVINHDPATDTAHLIPADAAATFQDKPADASDVQSAPTTTPVEDAEVAVVGSDSTAVVSPVGEDEKAQAAPQ